MFDNRDSERAKRSAYSSWKLSRPCRSVIVTGDAPRGPARRFYVSLYWYFISWENLQVKRISSLEYKSGMVGAGCVASVVYCVWKLLYSSTRSLLQPRASPQACTQASTALRNNDRMFLSSTTIDSPVAFYYQWLSPIHWTGQCLRLCKMPRITWPCELLPIQDGSRGERKQAFIWSLR